MITLGGGVPPPKHPWIYTLPFWGHRIVWVGHWKVTEFWLKGTTGTRGTGLISFYCSQQGLHFYHNFRAGGHAVAKLGFWGRNRSKTTLCANPLFTPVPWDTGVDTWALEPPRLALQLWFWSKFWDSDVWRGGVRGREGGGVEIAATFLIEEKKKWVCVRNCSVEKF